MQPPTDVPVAMNAAPCHISSEVSAAGAAVLEHCKVKIASVVRAISLSNRDSGTCQGLMATREELKDAMACVKRMDTSVVANLKEILDIFTNGGESFDPQFYLDYNYNNCG